MLDHNGAELGVQEKPAQLASLAFQHRSDFVFFQAEDGIRDYKVTGVQTCALPIYLKRLWSRCRCTGKCKEATNARMEMTRANNLMSRARRGMRRISSPPAAGMNVTSERMMGPRLSILVETRLVETVFIALPSKPCRQSPPRHQPPPIRRTNANYRTAGDALGQTRDAPREPSF